MLSKNLTRWMVEIQAWRLNSLVKNAEESCTPRIIRAFTVMNIDSRMWSRKGPVWNVFLHTGFS